MNIKLNKNQIIILLILLLLLLVFPFVLRLARQRQEIRKRAVGTEVVKLTLSPTEITKQQGDVIDIKVQLTSTQQIRVYTGDVDLQFDTNVFTISNINCAANFPTKAQGSVSNNIIYLTCGVPTGEGQPPFTLSPNVPVELGSFQATVKNDAPSGETRILFNRARVADENFNDVADAGTPGTYTIEGAPTPTPTFPPGQVRIKLKVKLAGIEEKRADQSLRVVKIGKENTILQELEGVSLTSDNQGIYESPLLTLSSAITAGSNYYLLVKGPKHLQVRFCQNSNQIRPCSTGNITLNNGENILNFTGYPLPGGDLPPQDGVVNAIDAVVLTNCLATPASEECLNKADLNLDGAINTLDINIMNKTIYTRWEDE